MIQHDLRFVILIQLKVSRMDWCLVCYLLVMVSSFLVVGQALEIRLGMSYVELKADVESFHQLRKQEGFALRVLLILGLGLESQFVVAMGLIQ